MNKTMELAKFGITEMSDTELKKTEGGVWPLFLLGLAAGLVLGELNDRNSNEDFQEGYEAGADFWANR